MRFHPQEPVPSRVSPATIRHVGRLRRASDDRRKDTVALLVTAGAVLASYGLGSAVQTVYVFRLVAQVAIEDAGAPIAGVAPRILVNGLTTLTLLLLLVLVRAPGARGWQRAAVVGGVAPAAAAARVLYQEVFGVYGTHTAQTVRIEFLSGTGVATVALVFAFIHVESRRRLRDEERTAHAQELRARGALEALQEEELRVRREVAEGLHGTVQQSLVLLSARVRALEAQVGEDQQCPSSTELLRELAALRGALDHVRDHQVRSMSSLLYPAGIEVGTVPAIRLLLQRVPASVGTSLVATAGAREVDQPGGASFPVERRLLALRVAEEALTNAIKHGHAGHVSVHVSRADDDAPALRITVEDDGRGMAEDATLSGLARLQERLGAVGGQLDVIPQPRGTRVDAIVPAASPAEQGAGT
jgi:two-component system, NarL family, sensor histidine kinase UhpB